jgi:hypothetical protein
VTQLKPRKNNNTFDHLGETGSELKLTVFPQKSSIPAPRLALYVERAGYCSHTNSLGEHFGKPVTKAS